MYHPNTRLGTNATTTPTRDTVTLTWAAVALGVPSILAIASYPVLGTAALIGVIGLAVLRRRRRWDPRLAEYVGGVSGGLRTERIPVVARFVERPRS